LGEVEARGVELAAAGFTVIILESQPATVVPSPRAAASYPGGLTVLQGGRQPLVGAVC
jgi:hypothetical protein